MTENSITYQAPYLLLLAELAPEPSAETRCFCPQTMRHGEGARAHLDVGGTNSLTANDLVLEVECAPSSTFGLFFFGERPAQFPVGEGLRCVRAPRRLGPAVLVNPAGEVDVPVDFFAGNLGSSGVALAGQQVLFQFWFRHLGPGGQSSFAFSDAIAVSLGS
ncbi:MAG: hypothetical protein AAF368_06415 [Planctomycetota bacterium]